MAKEPIGPENDGHIQRVIARADKIVVAWGARGHGSEEFVEVTADAVGKPLYCLGITGNGAPRHPLYVKKDQELGPWRA